MRRRYSSRHVRAHLLTRPGSVSDGTSVCLSACPSVALTDSLYYHRLLGVATALDYSVSFVNEN